MIPARRPALAPTRLAPRPAWPWQGRLIGASADLPGAGVARLAAYLAIFAPLLLLWQLACGAWRIDLGMTADEAAHFVNGLMIHDYLAGGLGTEPLAFARQYYQHYPRVSIGHWPPMFYLVEAAAMFVIGRSVAAALALQALIGGALAATTAAVVAGRQGFWIGAAGGLAILACPFVLFLVGAVMLDNFQALLVLLALLAWARFTRGGDWRWSALFALLAAAAILTKGNAWALGLLPPFQAALFRRWSLLRSWRTWLAAAIVLLLSGPWYAMTYRYVSAGFSYGWGFGYTGAAAAGYGAALPAALGVLGVAGFLLGAWLTWRQARAGRRDDLAEACVALVAATVCFQLLVPADIQPRYLIQLVPAAVIVAALGIQAAAARLFPLRRGRATAAAAVLLVLNGAQIFRLPHVLSLGMDQAADAILSASGPNPLVLAATSAKGEGALTAAFAAADARRHYFVIRASKALASSNFLGTAYRPRFADPAAVGRWIAASGIGWVVAEESPDSLGMLHNRQVMALGRDHAPGWTLAREYPTSEGRLRLYRLDAKPPGAAVIARVLAEVAPGPTSGF